MSFWSRRLIIAAAAVFAAGLAVTAVAADAPKVDAPKAETSKTASPRYHELMWGDPKAKVTVIEYGALTCPVCARFENDVFPDVKKTYIETGKIRYVFRDYPLDNAALAAAAGALTRCAPDDRGKKLIEVLYKNQAEWARAPQPIEPLRVYAALAGMSAADVDACLKDETLLKTINDVQNKAMTLYQVEQTPTFFVDDEKVTGFRTFADFAKILDKHVAKAK